MSVCEGIKIEWSNERVPDSPSSDAQHLHSQLIKEKTMNEDLSEIIKKLHHRLEAMDERDQKAANERDQIVSLIKTLRASLKTGEERFKAMENQYETRTESMSEQFEKEIREEHNKVATFVLRLDQRDKQLSDDVVSNIEDGQLHDVAKQLVEDYNVRLLAIDCGLSFLMDIPESEWATVEKCDAEIGKVLTKLLPRDIGPAVKWTTPISVIKPSTATRQIKRQLFKCSPSDEVHQSGGRTKSSQDDSVFLDSPEEEKQQADHNLTSGDAQATRLSRTPSSPKAGDKEAQRQRTAFRAQQDKEKINKVTPKYEESKTPKDVQIEHLKSRIKELEEELGLAKGKTSDRSGSGFRKEQERLFTMSLRFRFKEKHIGSFSDTFAPTSSVDLEKVANYLTDTFHVKLLGQFSGFSSDDSDIHPAFLLQTSMAERQNVTERQEDIQEALSELLAHPDVVWSRLTVGFGHQE